MNLLELAVHVGVCVSEEQSISEKLVYGVENNSTLLECRPRSLQASVMWYIQHGVDMEEVKTHI